MIRSVEFDLVTKIEPNARFASRAGMFAKAHRVKQQRAAVRAVLQAHLHVPPMLHVIEGASSRSNRIEVKLTRIAPGRTADAWENLRAALKAVKDEVAAWIGVDDREGGPVTWLDPGQEQGGQHVYRVRIEVTDLAPGEPRRVVLAETGSEARAAKSRVKRLVTKAAKGATKVTPEQRFRADSRQQLVSGARSDAEFARRLKDGDDGVTRRNGVLQKAGGGARAAAEAAWSKVAARDPRRIRSPAEQDADTLAAERAKVATKPARPDPDAEAMTAMRDLACSQRCLFTVEGVVCGALPGQPCRVIHDPAAGARAFQYGVHGSRARAAGLPPYPSAAELNAGVRPVRVTRECDGCRGTGTIQLAIEEVSHGACHGSGKVAAWRWEVPMSRADMKAMGEAMQRQGQEMALRPRPKPDGDPGEERPARDLAPCTTCSVHIGERCDIAPGERVIYGVHVARAVAAGLHVPEDDRAHVRPARASTTGVRKLAPVAGPPVLQAWARLPWTREKCRCEGGPGDHTCMWDGEHPLTREPRRDGADPPRAVRYKVPAEHVARFGPEVVLTRRPHVDASGESCWLYA